jgi:hypothetical protein
MAGEAVVVTTDAANLVTAMRSVLEVPGMVLATKFTVKKDQLPTTSAQPQPAACLR